MSNEGLSKDPMACACSTWARTDGEATGHNPACPMHPDNLIRDAERVLRQWGNEGDGIPEEHWLIYRRIALAANRKAPGACWTCGGPLLNGDDPGPCPAHGGGR